MKRLPLVVSGIVAILLASTFSQYSIAETAPVFVKQWGSQGLQTTGLFSFPQNSDVDSSGNIYVTDYGNRRIQKFDSDGNFLHTWGIKGSDNGQFQFPIGIAIQGEYVYVVDNELNRVQKFDTVGKYITQWGVKGSETGKFLLPQGIAVDPNGDVYVADTGNNRIQKFSADGKFLLAWGSSGLGNGQFLNLHGIAADSQGSIYVSDSGNNRIQKFTTDGIFIKSFDVSSGSSLKFPEGLDVDSSGNIYVADTGNNRMVKIDRDGNSLFSWGSSGQTSGNFNNPKDIVADSNGNVFVVDSSNHRIQKFASTTSTPVTETIDPVTETIDPVTETITPVLNPLPNDKTKPVISAPANVIAEANGILSTVLIGQATATDASGIASITNNAPTLFPIGDTIVTWTAIDVAGNSATTKQVVTVQDTTKPKITTPVDVVSEAVNPIGNIVSLGDATVIDNVEISSITNDAPSSFPLGTTTVTWIAVDTAGNTATATQKIKITDTTAPVIIPPSDVVFEAMSSTDNIVQLGDVNATDVQSVTITNDAPAVFPIGQTLVTWTATDAAGNSAFVTQMVTVSDTLPPTLVLPADVVAEATSHDHNIISIGQATTEDLIGVSSITNNAPAEFGFGQTIVTWTAVDTFGNTISANQTITIIDTTSPQLAVPKDIIAEATDPTSNIIDVGNADATDIIGIASVTNNAPDSFPIGITPVTWVAIDTSGNSVNATQTVTINDTTSPVVVVPADVIVEATSSSGSVISIGNADATDITGISSITNDAPATFPVGETIVTWTATDNSGNSANATQKITVVDTTSPTLSVPEDVIFEALAPIGNSISIGDASADDLVGVVTITNDAPSSFPLGETIVTWTATDAAGNSATAIQKVTVVDTT
ncbi:MAG TPA: HYR domain-containing protein, partial [Nitrosopumilaceae archaeon]|nr:HYR domain-containing protein [Nitrosopumilaceae archaeon]